MKSKLKKSRISIAKLLSLTLFLIVLMVAIFYYRSFGDILSTNIDFSQNSEVIATVSPHYFFGLLIMVHIALFSLGTVQNSLCDKGSSSKLKDQVSDQSPPSSQSVHPLYMNQLPKNRGV